MGLIPSFVIKWIVEKALVWLATTLGTDAVKAADKAIHSDWHYDPPPEHPIDPRNPYAEDRATQNQD